MEQEQLVRSNDINNENGNKIKKSSKFPLTFLEMLGASGVVLCFAVGLTGVYLTLPESDYSFLKLPKTIEDLHILRYVIAIFFTYPLLFFIKNWILLCFVLWV